MTGITSAIAFVGILLILSMPPMRGFLIYLMGLCWYPQALTLTLFSAEFSIGRIFILVLVFKSLSQGGMKRFKFAAMDFWVLASHVGALIAITFNAPVGLAVVRQAGHFIDTFLPYLVIRLLMVDHPKFIKFIQYMVLVAMPLAVLGAYQSLTGKNPCDFMVPYYSWGLNEALPIPQMRHGFYRACVTFNIHIVFGMYFAALAPMVLGLWHQKGWSRPAVIFSLFMMVLGTLSSMSSAPLFALVTSLVMLAVYRLRRYWRVVATLCGMAIFFVEAYSNRHVYHLLTFLSFDPVTAYYRAELFDEAFGGGMTGHWLVGYGYVGIGPGSDNSHFFWVHQDMTNIFICQLACFGLLGMIPVLVAFIIAFRRLYQASLVSQSHANNWLLWGFSSALVGWFVALQTVADMCQVTGILAMYFALCQNMPGILATENSYGPKWARNRASLSANPPMFKRKAHV